MRFALKHAALAAACMAAFPVQATNGFQMPGFGNRAIGMGGVGIAYGRDSLSQAANPANIVNTGMRADMGVAIFNAERHACTGVDTGLIPSFQFPFAPGVTFYPNWFQSLGFDGCAESDIKHYVMPEMGMTMPLTERLHVGMAFVPFGGGGTSYPYNFFSWETGTANTPSPDAKLGVDLMILQAPVTVAYKLNDNHAVGGALAFAVSRFRAFGLDAFAKFDDSDPGGVTTITSDPAHVTNQGFDYAYGAGVKLGYLGEFLDDRLTVGLVYNSRTYMTKFDKYRGLFAEQGDFDLPESYGIGFAIKPKKNLVIAVDVLRINFSDVASVGNRGPGSFTGTAANNLNGLPSHLDPAKELGNDEGMGFGWQDQTVYKLGVQYGVNQRLQVRAGVNYGRNPIPDDQLTFATLAPANTERHYSLGFTYRASDELEITGAYMYVPSNPQQSPLRQNIVGAVTIDMHQNIFGVTLGWVLDPGPGLSEYGDASVDPLDPSGIYMGFGMGQAKVNDWAQYSTAFVNESFGVAAPGAVEDQSFGFKVFGGYQFNKYFGVEGGFVDFNDVRAHNSLTGPNRSVSTTVDNDAWTLAAVGTLPLSKKVSVLGKLGVANWNSNLRTVAMDVNGVTQSATKGSDGYDVFYGLGASYALLDNIDLRAEYERYKFGDMDIDLMTAGVAVKF